MEKLFNTEFEFSLRILLLLSSLKSPMSQDTIRDLDLLTTYGKEFNISNKNLHGDKSYSISELQTRHALVNSALKELVKDGLVDVIRSSKGFQYKISEEGIRYRNNLSSDYSKEYISELDKILSFTRNMSEKELHQFTYNQGLRR